MIDKETRVLLENLKENLLAIRTELTLVSYDIGKIREQLEQSKQTRQPQENISIVPTLPLDYLPPEMM